MDLRRFLSELKDRNVVRMGGVYTVTAWGIFQVAKTVFETFELPKWISASTLILLAVGLPVVLVFSWAFVLGPKGLVRRSHAPDGPTRKMNWMDWGALAAVAAVVIVAVGSAVGLISSLGAGGLRPGPPSKSVAVLPFASFSSGQESEYFADGLTEEVINSLAQVPELKVAGRTSAFYFKGRNQDLREIGKQLGVAHVVEGSVRRSGARLRVTCQLISVKNGYHVWSQTYDRTMDDAFAIQSEIADGVADALKVELHAGSTAPRDRDPEAYALEVVAKGQVRHMGLAQLQSAQAIYKRLIEMEPDNASAHAGYAYATAYLVQNHLQGDFLPAVRQAESEIATALKLDPKSSSAYVARGLLSAIRFIREGDPDAEVAAEAAYKRAVDLAPRDPEALSLYGDFISRRRPAEAVPYLRRALEIDPLDRIASNALGGALFGIGQLEEAEARYRANIERFPDYIDSKEQLADLLLEEGRLDEAATWYQLAAKPQTDPAASLALANVYYNLGMPREAEAAFAPWRPKPVIGPVVEAVEYVVVGDYPRLMSFVRARLAEPEPDPLWRSVAVLAGAMTGEFEYARSQLLIIAPQVFEPMPKVSPRLANDTVGAAYVLERTGDRGQSTRLLQATIAATEPQPGLRQTHARRVARIKAFAMLGQKDRALAELREAIDNGYRQIYDIDAFTRLDDYPMVANLRADPAFRAMIVEIEADNARMRAALAGRAGRPAPPPVQSAPRRQQTAAFYPA